MIWGMSQPKFDLAYWLNRLKEVDSTHLLASLSVGTAQYLCTEIWATPYDVMAENIIPMVKPHTVERSNGDGVILK